MLTTTYITNFTKQLIINNSFIKPKYIHLKGIIENVKNKTVKKVVTVIVKFFVTLLLLTFYVPILIFYSFVVSYWCLKELLRMFMISICYSYPQYTWMEVSAELFFLFTPLWCPLVFSCFIIYGNYNLQLI